MLFLRPVLVGCVLLLLRTGAPCYSQIPKANIRVAFRAFPLGAFTKLPIDTVMIQVVHPMDTVLKHPSRFMTELRLMLAHKDTVSWQAFHSNFVRFWFHVTDLSGSYNLYVAQGSTLVWGHRLYRMDREIKEVFRRYIPEKNTYLPIAKRSKT